MAPSFVASGLNATPAASSAAFFDGTPGFSFAFVMAP
jgi:hypothetical protein